MDLEREWKKEKAPLTGRWWKDRIKTLWEESRAQDAQALFSEFEFDGGNSPITR